MPPDDLVPVDMEVEITVPRPGPIVGGRTYSLGFGSEGGVHHVVFATLRPKKGEVVPAGTSTVRMECDFPRAALHKLVPGLRTAIMEGTRPFAPCVVEKVRRRNP